MEPQSSTGGTGRPGFEPAAESAAPTVDHRSLYRSRIRRVQVKRPDGFERWLSHEPWRRATMSSPRKHEKRMAEIHSPREPVASSMGRPAEAGTTCWHSVIHDTPSSPAA